MTDKMIIEDSDRRMAAEIIRESFIKGGLTPKDLKLGTMMDANVSITSGLADDFWLVQLLAKHRSLG